MVGRMLVCWVVGLVACADGGGSEAVDASIPFADQGPGDVGGALDVGAGPADAADPDARAAELDGASRPADAGAVQDAASADAAPADAAPRDAAPTPEADAAAPAIDCTPIAAAGHTVCAATPTGCEAVFDDRSGCTAVCARAGLACAGAFEDVPDACAPDEARPPVACDSGHQSDYCVCAGPAVDPPPPPAGDRFASLLAERQGFGASARGGDPGRVYRVTTLRDSGAGSLRAALEDATPWWIVFDVDGRITWDAEVRLGGRKTVDGRGRAVVVDGTWRLQGIRDVIIADVGITRSIRRGEQACAQDGDGLLIRGPGGAAPGDFTTGDIWIHHCELFDGGDGLLDIRGGTDITVSWSHFHTHKKVTLAWQDADGQPAGGMRVTWHHNHFDRTTVRNPRFHYGFAPPLQQRLGRVVAVRGEQLHDSARMLTQANVFAPADDCVGIPGVLPCDDMNPCGDDGDWAVNRQLAVVSAGEATHRGMRSVGDVVGGQGVIQVNGPDRVPDPPYAAPVEVAGEALAARVRAGAGPRVDWRE
ncbi:MAG: hypothetical protein R3F60_32555 [bacterium]